MLDARGRFPSQGQTQDQTQFPTPFQTQQRSDSAGAEQKPGNGKVKALRAELAAEIARVEAALGRLREQVADLHLLQRDQEEGGARLSNRIDALEAAQATPAPDGPETGEALAARIDGLRARLDALYAESRALADDVADDLTVLRGRLPSAGLGLSLALVLLGLLILGAAAWWQTTQRLDRSDLRLDRLAQRLEQAARAEFAPAPVAPEPAATAGGSAGASQASVTALPRPHVAGRNTAAADAPAAPAELVHGAGGEPEVAASSPQAPSASVPRQPRPDAEPARSRSATPPAAQAVGDPARTADGTATSVAPLDQAGPAASDARQIAEQPTTAAPAAARPAPGPLVLAQPRWMVQLIGYHALDSVRAFAADEAQGLTLWTRGGRFRGRPWYSVLAGDYPGRAAAQAAIEALPPALRALEPIVREVPAGTALDPVR